MKHPKVIKAARILKVSIPAVIGHLHLLWWWCLEYAPDGEIGCFDAEDIAIAIGWEGDAGDFINALVHCGKKDGKGFLDRDGDSLSIHDWEEHCGKDYEKRQKEAERLRGIREKKKEQQTAHQEIPANGNDDTHEQEEKDTCRQYEDDAYSVRTQYDFERTTDVHGEKEKEKEKEKENTKNLGQGDAVDPNANGEVESQNFQETRVGQPQDGEKPEKIAGNGEKEFAYPPVFEEFWAAYPRKVAKRESYIAWKGEATNADKRTEALQAAKNYAAYVIKNKKDPEYILHAKTFMHKERWRDWVQGGVTNERVNHNGSPEHESQRTGYDPSGNAGFHSALERYQTDDGGNE
jgi:hypothetical protein